MNYSKLGKSTDYVWNNDPKRLGITLSRYKFVSKMVSKSDCLLEVGCGDSFQNRIVKQSCKSLTAIDMQKNLILEAKINKSKIFPVTHIHHNILSGPVSKTKNLYDGVFSLDVLEHIDKKNEKKFIKNSIFNLKKNSYLLVGMPSIESQKYASYKKKKSHINCKSGDDLKKTFQSFFHNVILFSMNDEVIHTGFSKMAHYLIVLCTTKK
jgi:2-polyprenyl-3-methyl-5-hydroxy-6-metoxy-1,4-benzoquinol methylase